MLYLDTIRVSAVSRQTREHHDSNSINMSIPNNYPAGCSEEEIYNTIKQYQEAIQKNQSVTVIVQRAAAIIQIGEIELAVRLAKKHREITQELKGSVDSLKEDISSYNKAATNESRKMRNLTVFLGIITLVQLFIAYQQLQISEEQSISERINQKRIAREAIEFCKQNPAAENSGLFEISTGKSAPCEQVLNIYGSDNSLWSKLKGLFD